MGVVIDSSVLIAIERASLPGEPVAVLERVLPEVSLISAVTVMELRIGALLGEPASRRAIRTSFLGHVSLKCPVVPFTEREAEEAARLFSTMRRAGQRIGERDLLIAASAIANGHSLVTLNRSEFERVPGLTLLDLPEIRVM